MISFCAICTADIVGEPLRRPLGKNDVIVNVCAGCDGDRPRERSYHRGYEQTPGLTFRELEQGVERLARSLRRRR